MGTPLALLLLVIISQTHAQDLSVLDNSPCKENEKLYCLSCTNAANEAACKAADNFEECPQADPVCKITFDTSGGTIHDYSSFCVSKQECIADATGGTFESTCPDDSETTSCIECGFPDDAECCAPPEWDSWGPYSACDGCGDQDRTRSRSCIFDSNPVCNQDGQCVQDPADPPAVGNTQTQTEECLDNPPCCEDPKWGLWGEYSTCDCGPDQTRSRSRSCERDEGADCDQNEPCVQGEGDPLAEGDSQVDVEDCPDDNPPCCDEPQWGDWTDFGECNCGPNQTRSRSRSCERDEDCDPNEPCVQGEGDPPAEGDSLVEVEDCPEDNPPCCEDASWSTWGTWSECSGCGPQDRSRSRTCVVDEQPGCNPDCSDPEDPEAPGAEEVEDCKNEPCVECPEDLGVLSDWGPWTCVDTCGYTVEFRNRTCDLDPKFYGDEDCPADCGGADLGEQRECDAGCCTHIGVLSEWTTWTCKDSCGYTTQFRNRTCDDNPDYPAYQDCPPSCDGELSEVEECDAGCCGNEGIWSEWTGGPCEADNDCGYGRRRLTRQCILDPHSPSTYSDCEPMCHGENESYEDCYAGCCKQDEQWGEWSEWNCETEYDCGYGQQSRHRECINNSHYQDPECEEGCGDGETYEYGDCYAGCCEQDEQWAAWSEWFCDVTCGYGTQSRFRECINNAHYADSECEKGCPGEAYEQDHCDAGCCDHYGVLSTWTPWTCLDSCGYTTEYRNRTCENNPNYEAYHNCPAKCDGELSEAVECDAGCCATDGVWSEWYDDGCDADCGYGHRRRYRTCQPDPYAAASYSDCEPMCHGPNEDYQECNAGCCDQVEQWSTWTDWACDVTCGYGTETRHRDCINLSHYPDPECEKGCGYEEAYQQQDCYPGCCDQDEKYTEWSTWEGDVTCGYGHRTRHRECKNYSHYPDPNCLKGCQGEEYQSEPFDAGCCDQDEQWTSWSEWNCDVTCGYGTKSRSRECINYSHYPNSDCQNGCKGAAYEEDHCDAGCCEHVGVLSSWTTWTCLASCGYTSEYRNRTCQNDPDFYGYHDCPPSCNGPLSEENECDAGCCDNPGVWSSWYEYPCDAECGYGNRRRTRTCEQDPNGPASYSDCSPMCYGPNEDNEECNAGCCDQDERYGEWSTWECDVTCGYGTQTRHRECINYSHYPDPKCAKGCGDGDIYESQDCNPGCCEQDEQWTQWSNWVCDVTCGYGTQTRTRDCRNNGHYPDSKCEKGCPGEGYQTEDCNAGCCDLRGEWDSWTNWACADECGYTQEYRNRTCINPHGHDPHYADCEVSCRGDDSDEASCFNGCCPHVGVLSEWSTWTCLDSCGYTTEYRNRTCLNDPGFYGYEDCPPECDGPLSQENECDAGCCGNPGVWSQWYSEECDAKCGYGQRRRYRTCEQDPYADESYSDCEPECHGPNEDFEACSAGCCDQEEKWGKWSRWSCDVTCGYGTQTRHRECENLSHYPDPKCAKGCGYGEAYQSGPCDAGCCESIPDGYGEWSYCSSSCGPGTRHREVFCQDNGYHCPCDLPKEEQPCYSGDCDVDQCVCRMLGDPVVSKYAAGEFELLSKHDDIVLSEKTGHCAFKVETKVGAYGSAGLIVPEYIIVTLDDGKVKVKFNDNHQIEVILPVNKAGSFDANPSGYTLWLTTNVDIYRNGDFIVIADKYCNTKIGYDSEGLYTTATIVVDKKYADGLTGECGECLAANLLPNP